MDDHAHSSSTLAGSSTLAAGSVPSIGVSVGEEADNETDEESIVSQSHCYYTQMNQNVTLWPGRTLIKI